MAHFGRRTLYLSGQALTLCFVLLIGVLACVPHSSTNHTATPPPSTFTTPTGNFTSPSDARFRRSVAAPSTPGMLVSTPSAINWSIAALLLLFTLTYDATIGPLCYSLVSEIPSTRLKSKTIVLARNCYNISGIVTNIVTPRMLNPTAWGWGARSGFFWAGTAVVGIVWSWWRLPEPKGRSYGELDELFARRTPARKFKGAVVGEAMGTVVDEKDGSVV
jgi:SP family general alpha glucoside:H+ symporter-like MFS transporter